MKAKFQICKNLHTIRFGLVRGYKIQADTEFTMGGNGVYLVLASETHK